MYCQHCGKATSQGQVICDECLNKGVSEEQLLDNTYIEEISPDALDYKAKGPVHPIKGKGITSMILGIVALSSFLFQTIIPGGIFTSLTCAILAIVFAKQASHTKGKSFANVGIITGIVSIVIFCLEVTIITLVVAIIIFVFSLSSIIAILGGILSLLLQLIN